MSKKLKKKKFKHVSTKKDTAPKSGSHIKFVTCVECSRGDVVVKMSTCKDCEYHDNNYCTLDKTKKRIRVVSLGEPMKFNRMTFQVSSEHIQDDARNYYFPTEIMAPVKNITDRKGYVDLKAKLLCGELCEPTYQKEIYSVKIKRPLIYLEKSTENVSMIYNGYGYREVGEFGTSGEWDIIYYLYEMFSYSGLADLMIDDRSFKMKLSGVCGYPEQLLVVGRDERIIIGERSVTQDQSKI